MLDEICPLNLLVRKLEIRTRLNNDDKAGILSLPYKRRAYERTSYLVREGEGHHGLCRLMVSGFGYRHRVASNGNRQLVGIVLPGDALDFQQLVLDRADHNIQAATRVVLLEINRLALKTLAADQPNVGSAIWRETLIDASIFQEWILNVGRRNAKSRLAHFISEYAMKMDISGFRGGEQYEFPLTQEQIGDATGLTSVHVNRMLHELVRDGAITYFRPYLTIADRAQLYQIAGFNKQYLHLDQLASPAADPDFMPNPK